MKNLDYLSDRLSAEWTYIFDQFAAAFANACMATGDKDGVDRLCQTNRAIIACFLIMLT
jgi:hypothetical protein